MRCCTWATTSTSSPTASTATARRSGRVPLPAGEATTLADYRQRYATYRSDVDLQAAHAAHPFIVVWDDHEIINDASRDGAPRHTGHGRAVARRGWPSRVSGVPGMDAGARGRPTGGIRLYRDFRFGRLVDLLMLDTRGLRDRQAAPRDAARSRRHRPAVLLGADAGGVALREPPAVAAGGHTRGGCSGQQILFAPLTPPGVAPQNTDVWDGYPAARTRVLDYLDARAHLERRDPDRRHPQLVGDGRAAESLPRLHARDRRRVAGRGAGHAGHQLAAALRRAPACARRRCCCAWPRPT